MTDQLDARIRALVREVVDSSPAAPRFEDIESALLATRRAPARHASYAGRRRDRGLSRGRAGDRRRAPLRRGTTRRRWSRRRARPTTVREAQRVCRQGLREQPRRQHGVGDHHGDGWRCRSRSRSARVQAGWRSLLTASTSTWPTPATARGRHGVGDRHGDGRGVGHHPRRQGSGSRRRSLPTASTPTCSTRGDWPRCR